MTDPKQKATELITAINQRLAVTTFEPKQIDMREHVAPVFWAIMNVLAAEIVRLEQRIADAECVHGTVGGLP